MKDQPLLFDQYRADATIMLKHLAAILKLIGFEIESHYNPGSRGIRLELTYNYGDSLVFNSISDAIAEYNRCVFYQLEELGRIELESSLGWAEYIGDDDWKRIFTCEPRLYHDHGGRIFIGDIYRNSDICMMLVLDDEGTNGDIPLEVLQAVRNNIKNRQTK